MTKPIGSKRITQGGYVQIKTLVGQRRWPFEHRFIWEQHNGLIPDGAFVHHINKDKTDNRIENLELVLSNSKHHREHHNNRPKSHGKKISKALKGKPKSKEHARKISEALKGKHKSAKHRQKLSEALAGRERPDISASLKGRKLSESHRNNVIAAAINRPRSPETGRFLPEKE